MGDGKFWIARFNPDFIGRKVKKQIIEVFGDYWHNLPEFKIRDEMRLKAYAKAGFKTLIIWEQEFDNLEGVGNKVLDFVNSQ